MHKKHIHLLLAFAITLASCTWEEVKLKMQFVPAVGDVYHTHITMDQVIVQTMFEQEMAITQTIGFDYSMTATEKDADGTWVSVVYDRVLIKQQSPTGEVNFDSANPPDEVPPAALAFKVLVGKGFAVKINSEGKTIAIRGVSEFLSAIIKDFGIEDEATLAQIEKTLQAQYNDETLQKQMGDMLIQFPTGVVKVGDTWTARVTTGSTLPLVVENTYTLDAFQDNIATIRVESTVSADPEAKSSETGPYQIKYALSGTQTGTMAVDISTGWTANSTITQTITGTLTLISGDNEMQVPMTVDSVIHVETGK